jgi:hypothetical protein
VIAEAINTAISVGWAIVAWIVLTSAAACLALYTVVVAVWTVARTVWRVGRAVWRAVRKPQAPVSRPEPASRGSRAAGTPPEPAQRRTAPSWARTDTNHQEAA